jgi:oligogalacturonide lyase
MAQATYSKFNRAQFGFACESIPRGRCEESGAHITQLTSSAFINHHIYPETPVFTSDSKRFVYSRFSSVDTAREYWLCNLENHALQRLTSPAEEPSVHGAIVTPDGRGFIYASVPLEAGDNEEGVIQVRRLSIDEPGARSTLLATISGFHRPYPIGTLTSDGRYYATSALQFQAPGKRPLGSILVADLSNGRMKCIHQGEHIFNPHSQFEPGARGDLLIQHNRGGILDENGDIITLVGEEGATVYLIDREGGNLRRLNVGKPYSHPMTGHQVWLGESGRILASLVDLDPAQTNLVTVGLGDERPRPVSGNNFNHIAASPDGRYFLGDQWPTGEIIIGSVVTGKSRLFCHSGASCGRPQYTHAHPFFSPDMKHVLFNSDRTGIGHIYAASVPDGLLSSLD